LPVDAHQYLKSGCTVVTAKCRFTSLGGNMLSIVIMLFLLAGFYGLFAGLVFFSEDVIEPDARP